MTQNDIDQFAAPRAHLTSAAARLVFQAETVFFELKKFFVSRENVGRTLLPGDGETIFSMRQDFLKVSRSRHCRS